MNLNRDLHRRIESWLPQSTSQEVSRLYVLPRMAHQLKNLEDGNAWLVLGRKGSGKSAIVNKFAAELHQDSIVRKKDLDPNLLYHRLRFFGEEFDLSNAEAVFRLDIMLIAMAELSYATEDNKVAKEAERISAYYGSSFRKYLLRARKNIAGLLALAGRVSGLFTTPESLASTGLFNNIGYIDEEFENVRRRIKRIFAAERGKRIYIVFDELDLKISDRGDPQAFNHYASMLKSLLSACASFHDVRADGIQIYPIVVLRDDIYENIERTDRNKWQRSAVEVKYSQKDILDILNYRLTSEMLATGYAALVKQNSIQQSLSEIQQMGGILNNNHSILPEVLNGTMLRPRDITQYYRYMSARVLENQGKGKAGKREFYEARILYSEYLWNEILDELAYVYEFAEEIEPLLKKIFFKRAKNKTLHTVYVSKDEVVSKFESFCEDLERQGYSVNPTQLIQDLLRRSVLGVQLTTNEGPREFYYFLDEIGRDIESISAFRLHKGIFDYFRRQYKSETGNVVSKQFRQKKPQKQRTRRKRVPAARTK